MAHLVVKGSSKDPTSKIRQLSVETVFQAVPCYTSKKPSCPIPPSPPAPQPYFHGP